MTTNSKSARQRLNRIAAALFIFIVALNAQQPDHAKVADTERLVQTAKVWIAVKYFHPYLAYRSIDWDKALIDALPKIRSAQANEEYAAALDSMLAVLHDPGSHIVRPGNVGPELGGASGQRIWVHYGFPPESGPDSGLFYSAFAYRSSNLPVVADIPVGGGFRACIRLDEASGTANALAVKPDSYPDSRYPSAEYRILAAFKIWGVIHEFFAYRDLMDEDWDDLFASFLPRFIAAKDAREYDLTVADMLTHTFDSHVTVTSDEMSNFFGNANPGVRLRLVEKQPVITEIVDDSVKTAGLHVGDIVAKIDGTPTSVRFNKLQDYISGSTAQRRGYDSIQRVLDGVEGSTVTLLIAGQDGPPREVTVKRATASDISRSTKSIGDVIRTLPDNIGYVDLTRLPDEQVPDIFAKLRGAKAIIFDARGEVTRAKQAIASHLTSADDIAGAIVTGPMALLPDVPTTISLTSTASYFFVEKIPDAREPKYSGKTVMLIDERTIGAAEHLGLWLEAANNTAFIGTASAGAEGEISNFVLPGGITVTFSGRDVRHGNTGKLQRLGLQPTVVAAPTVKGIRQGSDEVLDKAVEYLSDGDAHRVRAAARLHQSPAHD